MRSVKEGRVSRHAMSSRSSDPEPAYLGKITVTAIIAIIAIIVAGKVNHLLCRLRRGQDLPHGGEIVVIVVVVGTEDFSILRELGRANRWE
jgi:hypothetical protein